jgi:hypothetical protein
MRFKLDRAATALCATCAVWCLWPLWSADADGTPETVQADAGNATRQTASQSSPQAGTNTLSGILPATVPDADEKDYELWRKAPEYKPFEDQITAILAAGEARGARAEASCCLTSNEVAALIAYMQSPHPRARVEAVITAQDGRSDPARSALLPHVIRLLSDPFWRVRMWAAATLGEVGDKSMIPLLEPLLNDRPEVVRTTQRAISKLQQKDDVPKDR